MGSATEHWLCNSIKIKNVAILDPGVSVPTRHEVTKVTSPGSVPTLPAGCQTCGILIGLLPDIPKVEHDFLNYQMIKQI